MFSPAIVLYSKTCEKRPLSKRQKIGFQDQLLLNAGQKYCRIFSTFIKLLFVIKIFVLSILSGRFTHVLLFTFCSHLVQCTVLFSMFYALLCVLSSFTFI